MKISHAQLEAARADPAGYAPPTDWRLGLSKFRVLQFAVYQYHSSGNDLPTATAYLDGMFHKHFRHGHGDLQAMLVDYVDEYLAQGATAFEWNKRIELVLTPALAMGGVLSRLDISPAGGYNAWHFARSVARWEGELRWPLLQLAVGRRLGTDPTDCAVGIYFFEDGIYESRRFSTAEIDAALAEARRIADLLPGR
jgi:hypothetical protein